ncbi:Poly-beta-1 6-N-acetyl-D-glucosamine synthase [termite gut metagenome]|uniref:Poly-beta-1 6-N-acetyl-D-glucosamine synthase n=1 Tax=termite gut metagenome TaxID=433724 RepID=A0A5J4RE46_9ZZZZ
MEAIVFSVLELTLLSILGILWLIQLIYYFALYNRIHKRRVAIKKRKVRFTPELFPLSVIIYTRDDYEKLRKFLPMILEQDYPEFEVIVINDSLENGSEELLSLMKKQYPHLHYTFIPTSARYVSRKKLALTLGAKASNYEWLVFTEANCYPASNKWLRLMARNFTVDTQIVLGYSNFQYKNDWSHKCKTFELLFMSLRYLGFALANKPYMGIGRNMAYRKELFFKQKGFSSHLNLNGGADDLFINQIANKSNTRVEVDSDATIRIQPLANFDRNWKEEKMAYVVTAKYLRGFQQMLLKFETFSRLLFHICFTGSIIFFALNHYWHASGVAALLWLIRYSVQAFVINKTSVELGDKRQYYFTLPIFDILLPLQTAAFNIYCLYWGKSYFMKK